MCESFEQLQQNLIKFTEERDWSQFHSPKNLAMALSVEVSELMEPFQWLTEEQSFNLNDDKLQAVSEEIADVQLYLIQLASKLNIDILKACELKMIKNAEKYPVNQSKGCAKKYNEF